MYSRMIVTVNESVAELVFRLKQMGEDPVSDYRLNKMICEALIDAKSMLVSLDRQEIETTRCDPMFCYMQDDVLNDPFEAFHFNVIEEVSSAYIKYVDTPAWSPPRGFNVCNLPTIVLLY